MCVFVHACACRGEAQLLLCAVCPHLAVAGTLLRLALHSLQVDFLSDNLYSTDGAEVRGWVCVCVWVRAHVSFMFVGADTPTIV